jgi:hypothetical protein
MVSCGAELKNDLDAGLESTGEADREQSGL